MMGTVVATVIFILSGCVETLPIMDGSLVTDTVLSYTAENTSINIPMGDSTAQEEPEIVSPVVFVPTEPSTPASDNLPDGSTTTNDPDSANDTETLPPAPADMSISRSLERIGITGSTLISEGQSTYFVLFAVYSDGSTEDITALAQWSVKESIGSFVNPGEYQSPAVVADGTRITLTARYSENNVIREASHELGISHAQATLTNSIPTIEQGELIRYTVDTGDKSSTANQLVLNATDTDNDALTWSFATDALPTNGNAEIISPTTANRIAIRYTPSDSTFAGPDSFAVNVEDGKGGQAHIFVKVEVVRKTVYARDFAGGFNTTDVTTCLQTAINSGAARVVVTNEGTPWITGPINLASNQEIYFEEGVVVQAIANDAEGNPFTTYKSLFTAKDKENITLTGNGATLQMNKSEYMNGQWRHVLSLNGSTSVIVQNLTLRDSGGDGVYVGVGENQKYCKDIYLQNLVCDSNYRNAISIISVENLYINGCELTKTSGSLPQSGIDIEPNSATNFFHRLVNVNIQNTQISDNAGNGITMCFRNMDSSFPNVSINLENVTISGNVAVQIMNLWDNGPAGLINFKKVTIQNAEYGIKIYNKSKKSAKIQFESCLVSKISSKSPAPIKVSVFANNRDKVNQPGGINFSDCTIIDQYKRPVIKFTDEISSNGKEIWDVAGIINASNTSGIYVDWNGATQNNVSLVLQSVTSN